MPRVYVYNRNSPACHSAILKITARPIRPGMIIPLTSDEFDALRDEAMCIEFDSPPTKGEKDGSTIQSPSDGADTGKDPG